MRQSSLPATPLFADWLFTSKLHISEEQRLQIIKEVKETPKTNNHYGFETAKNTLGKDLAGLRNHLSTTFFSNAISHFSIDSEKFTTQSCDARAIAVKPGQSMAPIPNIKRWYYCMAFLEVDELGSHLELKREDARMHTTPRGIEMPMRIFKAKPLDVFYWPAYIPWGLTSNKSDKATIVFTNTFTFVKATPQTIIRPL